MGETLEAPIKHIKPTNSYYSISIEKENGGVWEYKLKNELTTQEIEFLKIRKKENWPILAIAKFKKINKNLLHLSKIGI